LPPTYAPIRPAANYITLTGKIAFAEVP
jgi:hypothetical protein